MYCKVFIVVIVVFLGVLESTSAVNNATRIRLKRQARNLCRSDPLKYQCDSGSSCIESEKICDGSDDCSDGSDEKQSICMTIPCPGYLFRCDYGACIDSDQRCDGKKQCKDGSDERSCSPSTAKVNTNCRSDEFECKNGQCIEMDARCNGQEDCLDKSDETAELCLNTDCPGYTYKCGYGACVDGDAQCNGVKDCADNSDEANCVSFPTTSKTPVQPPDPINPNQCKTPPQPDNGRWIYFYHPNLEALPNVGVPPKTQMVFRCNDGYKLSTTLQVEELVYCTENGQWSRTVLPQCQRLCPKRVNKDHATVVCKLRDSVIPCDKATFETQMTYTCDSYFEPTTEWSVNTCGESGEWYYGEPRCKEKCGEKRVAAEALVIGGTSVIRGEYPWVVALYSNRETSPAYTNICGGSVLTTSIVITAAHCVTYQRDGALIHQKYFMVSAGKYYNAYGDHRDNNTAQYSAVNKIVTHEEYRGEIQNFRYDIALLKLATAFALSKVVQPVCVRFNDFSQYLLRDQPKATVTGWGFTRTTGKPSEVLKVVELPYVDNAQCRTELDPSFANQYLLDDKICAGYVNKNTSVCKGDSGGGLVVEGPFSRYYLQGVVSLGQGQIENNINSCNSERRALFTNFNKYSEWVQSKMQLLS